MKVALLTPSISFDREIETPVVRLFAERMSEVVDLHVFALRQPSGSVVLQRGAMALHPQRVVDARFARRLARTVQTIQTEHDRTPFDVLHALWLHEPGTVAVAAGTLLRTPVVASVGGAEVVALPEIGYGALREARGRLMTANVLQRAALVTGGSTYVLRQARRVVPRRDTARFRLAPLPVDTKMFAPSRSRRAFDPSSPRVLHAASLIPVKDQATLLRAFRRVADALPGARLTIAGEDPLGHRAELEQLRYGLRLDESVTFVGPLPHARMPGFYADADLFVLSSRHESQAMVVLEAAAAGVPTVGTAVGVVPDLAPECAIAVRPGKPVALADAITALLTDPARLERMGSLARRRAVTEYDATVVVQRFIELYEEAIGRPPR